MQQQQLRQTQHSRLKLLHNTPTNPVIQKMKLEYHAPLWIKDLLGLTQEVRLEEALDQ